jgi:hypothetical protein
MKLFTKEVDKQLFAQYPKGSSLENQMVVAKIFNPYGRGVWYLLNSDPEDPDYIWAIVDLFEPEMGSVSRSELQTVKVPPFGLGLERDIYFTPKPAKEVFEGVLSGKRYAAGGMTPGRYYIDNSGNELRYVGESQGKLLFKDGEKIVYKSEEDFEDRPKETKLFGFFEKGGEIAQENNEMLQSNIVELKHHADELDKIVTNKTEVEPWVIAKTERASTDLSDVTHYLDGEKKKGLKMPFKKGGYMAQGGKVLMEIDTHKAIKDGNKIKIYRKELEFDSNYDIVGEKLKLLYSIPSENEDDLLPMFEDFKETNRILMSEANSEFSMAKGGYMARGGKISYEGKEGKIVSKKGDMYFVEIEKYHPNGDTLRTVLREGEFKKMADGGMLPNGKYKYEKGDEGMFQGDEVRVVKYHNGDRTYEYNIIDEDGKVKTHGVAKAEKFENQFRYFPKMAKGVDVSNFDPQSIVGRTIDDAKVISVNEWSKDMFWVVRESLSGLVIEQGFYKDDLIKLSNGEKVEGLQMMAKGGVMNNHKWYVVSAKENKVVSKGFDSEEEAKKAMYDLYEKSKDFSLATRKMARGGEITPYIVWVSKDGEKRELFGEFKSKRAADMKMNKLWESGEYKQIGNKPVSMYQKEGFYAHGGETKGKRYKVNVYYGGEMEDEEFYTDSLDEAKRVSQRGEHSEIYDNHKKEFVEIEYAKGGTTESYEVELSAESNPDYDKSSYEGSVNIKSHKVKAKSIEEAREIVVAFIMENDLGSGNWSGGNVYKNGKKIGHVSYNGRYWDDTKMAKGGQMKQNYIIKLLDALRLAMKRSEGNRWYTHGTIVSLKGYDKMSLNYLIPNDYPISNEYRVGLEAKLSYKKDNVQYNYEFSTKNKEKSENIDNARKITWIYMPLTQDVAKQIYNQLEKQGDIKELETWSMENSYAKGGKLVGKQKNLDVNKNGKLDAEDFKMLRGEKMAMGGKVKFEDKVKAIKESLLKRKKVSPKVQKDYGKTYSPKEAEESAKRIAASQRLKYELKKK